MPFKLFLRRPSFRKLDPAEGDDEVALDRGSPASGQTAVKEMQLGSLDYLFAYVGVPGRQAMMCSSFPVQTTSASCAIPQRHCRDLKDYLLGRRPAQTSGIRQRPEVLRYNLADIASIRWWCISQPLSPGWHVIYSGISTLPEERTTRPVPKRRPISRLGATLIPTPKYWIIQCEPVRMNPRRAPIPLQVAEQVRGMSPRASNPRRRFRGRAHDHL